MGSLSPVLASASVMLTLIPLFCTEDMLAMAMLAYHSPLAPVLTQSPRDLMPPPKELLPMLTMAMDLDTMASVMLRLILLFCTEDMLAMAMLEYHSPPALVLTQSPRDLMPPPKDLLPMLTMATDLDTMANVTLTLIPNFSMVAMLAMLDILMPMVSPILLTWDFVLTILVLRCLAKMSR